MRLQARRDIGLLIRDRRQRKGWTQEQFATMLGKTRRWMMQVELAQTNPDISSVLRALRFLDVALVAEDVPASEPDELLDEVLSRTTRGKQK